MNYRILAVGALSGLLAAVSVAAVTRQLSMERRETNRIKQQLESVCKDIAQESTNQDFRLSHERYMERLEAEKNSLQLQLELYPKTK